ncbi:MAG: hypothetical protein WCV85_01555 [Patescibacteria group bacterium]|jgi:hypothetical protein
MWYIIGVLALCFAATVYAFALYDQRSEAHCPNRKPGLTKHQQAESLMAEWRNVTKEEREILVQRYPGFFLNKLRVFWCMLLGLGFLFAAFILLIIVLLDFR